KCVEGVGWFGIAPVVPLAATRDAPRGAPESRDELRLWRIVAAAFAIWALGPFLTIGGFDTGLKLPAILLRYVPFVANARMPGRAMVGVFMATAVLLAIQLAGWPAEPLPHSGEAEGGKPPLRTLGLDGSL